MTIRWVALIPDPVTGLDRPVEARGKRLEWLAPDRKSATELAKVELAPRFFRFASIISVVDFEARKQFPQRPKAVTDPSNAHRFIVRNASRRCLCCGSQVNPSAYYCPEHRSQKRRKAYADAKRSA